MPLSMYQASVPVLLRNLKNLSAVMEKAAQDCGRRNISERTLIEARLYPDMLSFKEQIDFVILQANGVGARLAGLRAPPPDGTGDEASFDVLRERLAECGDFLRTLKPEQIDGSEDREITFDAPGKRFHFTGQSYLLNFALPNFYFHYSIAYGILRHNGVPLGKLDFLG